MVFLRALAIVLRVVADAIAPRQTITLEVQFMRTVKATNADEIVGIEITGAVDEDGSAVPVEQLGELT